MRLRTFYAVAAACAVMLPFVSVKGEENTDPVLPTTSETIQVTATKVPEDILPLPVAITVIDGEELEACGATDLSTALTLVGGVTAAPGGDNGPAGSVPELWGLREADAFLLVVDGVPWGGAFNPDLPTVNLVGVERIEVLRGAAPVLYGATSFVGVIQVIHRDPGTGESELAISSGSHGSGSVALAMPLPSQGGYQHSLIADYLEMAAREMASTGFIYSPSSGFFGSLIAEYVGERFLNKRNTAVAPSYTTWDAGIGYRFAKFDIRLDGRNLSDERPPVAESEFGDAQYYRLPARRFALTFRRRF